MGRKIETDDVTSVLLADGWHDVAERSFYLDDFEFQSGAKTWHGSDMAPMAAAWKESDGTRITCPITAILALRMRPRMKNATEPQTEPEELAGATPAESNEKT